VVNNRIIVAGIQADGTTFASTPLRWTVSLTPVVTEGCNDRLIRLIGELKSAGALTSGAASSLLSKIDAASRQAAAGKTTAAKYILDALEKEINALQASRKLTAVQADSLKDPITCVLSAP
jgi:hypothetical protein